jgi:hypothetical protein
VATVSQTGVVTGVGVGSANITATAAAPQGSSVSNTVTVVVNAYTNAYIDFDNRSKYQTTAYYTDSSLDFAVNYHAGSDQTVDAAGIKFFLRELNANWGVINDRILIDNSSVGQVSGSLHSSFSLAGLTPSNALAPGNFYFLFAQFKSTDGNIYNMGVSPIKIEDKSLVKAFIDFDSSSKYQTTTYYTNSNLAFSINYYAGAGQKVNATGVKFYLRELNANWGVIKDTIVTNSSAAGQVSGNLNASFSLAGLTPSTALAPGNFYFLFAEFKATDGKIYNKGVSPIKINNP